RHTRSKRDWSSDVCSSDLDTIYAETRVLDKRESSSKNDRGIVTVETKAFNQRGEEVCYFRRKVMVWKRDAAPFRQRPYEDAAWKIGRASCRGRVRSWVAGV